jgi:hypothetical protein
MLDPAWAPSAGAHVSVAASARLATQSLRMVLTVGC